MNQPQVEQPATIRGLSSFLYNCPSAALATAINGEIGQVTNAKGIDWNSGLSHEFLNDIRQALYSRTEQSGAEADVLMMLADAMKGGSSSSRNPMESRLRFIEILQEQITKGDTINFQLAYESAMSI